mgnify:CR=1 FL=1
MKKRITIIIGIFITLILGVFLAGNYLVDSVGGFTTSKRTITKNLNKKEQLIKIVIDENAEFPHSMDLTMKGEINGIGILQYGWSDSTFYRTDTISEKFLLDKNGGDWYNDNLFIKYTPLTATEGQLKIDCSIYSSKKKSNDSY